MQFCFLASLVGVFWWEFFCLGGFCLFAFLFCNIGVNIVCVGEGTNKWVVTVLGRMLLKSLGKVLLLADTCCSSILTA